MPPIISFVGRSGSGKTTFLEKLIQHLHQRGYRVGCVKHDAHYFDIDHPGKDTWRLTHAGSNWVAIANEHRVAIMGRVEQPPQLHDLVAHFEQAVDIVLTEGYRQAGTPRIEIVRMARSNTPLVPLQDLFALVTDGIFDTACPVFALNDVRGVANLIERYFLE